MGGSKLLTHIFKKLIEYVLAMLDKYKNLYI